MTWLSTVSTAAVRLNMPTQRLRGESVIEDFPLVDRRFRTDSSNQSGRRSQGPIGVAALVGRASTTFRRVGVWSAPSKNKSGTFPIFPTASRLMR
jgi:hypothetical protein